MIPADAPGTLAAQIVRAIAKLRVELHHARGWYGVQCICPLDGRVGLYDVYCRVPHHSERSGAPA